MKKKKTKTDSQSDPEIALMSLEFPPLPQLTSFSYLCQHKNTKIECRLTYLFETGHAGIPVLKGGKVPKTLETYVPRDGWVARSQAQNPG